MTRRKHLSVVSDDLDELRGMVADLTGPIRHSEHYTRVVHNRDGSSTWVGDQWVTVHPCLLDQLHTATHQAAQTDVGGRPGYMSKPTARLDAVDALVRIDEGAVVWLRRLGKQRAPDARTTDCVRLLGSLVPSLGEGEQRQVAGDVRRWWVWARVVAGWESPPWKPDNTCPMCAARGCLRVRLDSKSAVCNECWETWGPETIGLLADHIRAENAEDGVLSAVGGV